VGELGTIVAESKQVIKDSIELEQVNSSLKLEIRRLKLGTGLNNTHNTSVISGLNVNDEAITT
jgi:hypothetical protein